MIKHRADKEGKVVGVEESTPVCSVDFCDNCGECLACHGGDLCREKPSDGAHRWVVYEGGGVGAEAGPCRHVRGSSVVPGWGCCACRSYNGYQRATCRFCGHPHCYDESGQQGQEARELAPIGSDPDLVRVWLEKGAS